MIKRAVGIESTTTDSLSKFLEKDVAPFDGKDDRASVDTAAMTYTSSETTSVTTTTTKDFRVRKLNHNHHNHDDDATLPSIKSLVDTIDTIDDNDDDDDDDDDDEPNQLSHKRPARNHVRFTIEPENDDGSESSLVHASFNSHNNNKDKALKNHHYTPSSPTTTTTTTACQQREEEEEEEESTILGCCPECNALLFLLQSGNNNNNGISVMHSVCMVCSSKSLVDPSVDLQTKEHLLEDLSHSLDRIACRLAWHSPETSLERAQMEIGWALSKPSQQRDWQFLSTALTRAVADIDETYLQLWTNHEWAVQPTPLNELADIRRFVQETFPELRWKVATRDALLIYIVEQVNQATMGFDAHWMPSSEQEEQDDEDAWWPTSQENAELHEIRKFLLTQCQSCASNKFSLRTAERKVAQCVERLSWIRKYSREEEIHQGLQQLLSNNDSAHQRTERLESQLAVLHAHSLMSHAATLFKSSATATTAPTTTTAPSTSAVEVRPLQDPARETSSLVPVDDTQRATSSIASRSESVEILPDEQSVRDDASSHSSTEHTAVPRFSASDEARLRQLLRSCSPRVTESASQLKRTLDSITSFLTQSKGWDVAAADVVRVVAGVLDHWATNADSQAQSFLVLEACARKNTGIEAIVSTSCISKVSASMSRCPDHVVLQQNSCKFLSAMAEEAQTFPVPPNDLTAATTAVATTMAKHQFNKTIQTWGCKMCYHLSLSSQGGMQEESLQQFSRLAVNALCSLPQDVKVQQAACLALWHVARREGSHQLLGFVGAPDAVVATMRQHWSKASVVLPACGFLADMATLDPTSKDCVHGLGGLDTLVSALAHHQASKDIVQTALEALRNLAFRSPSTQQAIVATDGAVGTIVNAMYAHNRHAQVQVAGLGVLTQLSYTPGLAEQLLMPVGNKDDDRVTGLGVVFAAMGRHVVGDNASVQLLGWALVWRCLCRCPRFPRAAAKGIGVLILSMECFAQDADIQCHACGALSHLLELDADDSNRRKLVEEGAFRALLMAVLHHPANSVVQRFASSAISKLLGEDPGLTNRAHELLLLTDANSNARRGSASSSSNSSSSSALVAGPQDIELILRKMQDNPSCRETQKNGLVFLSKIASPQRGEHFGSNAMHTIVSIMSQHADDADIQFHGCAILLSVANTTTNDNDDNDDDDEQCPPPQQQQQGNAVVKAVVAASKAHLDNPHVQTVTLKVLKLLAMNDEIRSTIVMHGGVVQMMEAIFTKHPNQVLVLRNGTSLVSFLVQHEPNSFRNVRSTLLNAILQPMRNHPKDESIQTSCCRVVEQLSQFLQTKTLLVKANVVPRIVSAMRDFRNNYELQLHAFQTLKNLSTQQQPQPQAHNRGDVEILVGLRNWPRDQALQVLGYDALATLWTNKKSLATATAVTTTTATTASAVVVGGRHPTTTTPVVATSVSLLQQQQQQQQTNQQQTLLFIEALGSTLDWHAKNPAVLRQALRALAQFIDSPDNLQSVQTQLPNIPAQIESAMNNIGKNHSGLKHMVQHVLMRIKV